MAKFKGLGKGLDALLSASNVSPNVLHSNDENTDNSGLKVEQLHLYDIRAGVYQPRKVFNQVELESLADSIKHNGVIQPIVVRKHGLTYEIIAGERRFRASELAGLKTIPAIIRELNDSEVLAIALIENIQRKDLSVIEEAQGYKRLVSEFSVTHEDLAQITGKSRSHISNIIRLLNLADEVQEMVLNNQLDMGHARALLSLPAETQIALAKEAITQQLTTKAVESRVAQLLNPKTKQAATNSSIPDIDISGIEDKIANKLGLAVGIKHGNNGTGQVVIKYTSKDELDSLLLNLF